MLSENGAMLSKEQLADPGYTPRRRDLGCVMDWLLQGDDATAKLAERALVSAGDGVIEFVAHALTAIEPEQRVRCTRLLGRLGQRSTDPRLGELLRSLLSDQEPRVARSAIVAMGKLPSRFASTFGAEAALIELLPRSAEPERRAIIDALGKIGTAAAVAALDGIAEEGGEREAGLMRRAKLRLGRSSVVYDDADRILLDVPLGDVGTVVVLHRRGLSEIVGRQLSALVQSEPDGLERRRLLGYAGTLGELYRSRSLLVPALAVELVRPSDESRWATVIADAICQPRVVDAIVRLTSTLPRLRFTLPREGHQRSLLWEISEAVARKTDRIQANPQVALWEAEIDRGSRPRIFLVPRRFEDPRFTYRVRDISGASHPTIAAALADMLDVREDDVIWDPFVGSGLELIECALARPYRELIGTDNNSRSLEAAAANVAAARIERVRLLNADARTARLQGITGIVTNPPLGIRHHRDGQLGQLLLDFLANARHLLRPSGRIVWLSPLPSQTARQAKELGFSVTCHGTVDVGGLSPELQVLRLNSTMR
jgi:predicted RNA methylase